MSREEIDKMCEVSSVGHKVTLLYHLAMVMDILIVDIDRELQKYGPGFEKEKKRRFNIYAQSVRDTCTRAEQLNIDNAIWKATGDARSFDSVRGTANELLRYLMLLIDRTQSRGAAFRVFRYLKRLQSAGIFTEGDIARFSFGATDEPKTGDIVNTPYGKGVIDIELNNGDYMMTFGDGTQRVINIERFL